MKKVIVALVLMLGLSLGAFAQDYSVKKGYKGFIEGGYTRFTGISGYSQEVPEYDAGKIDWTTTHGYQINPYLFVGAGVSLDCYTRYTKFSMPIFADVRVTPLKGNITPYIDVKGGYTGIGWFKGLYFVPTIGCRFGLTNRTGLYVGLGYSLQQTNTKMYEWDPLDKIEDEYINFNAFTFKVGFDF